MTGAERIAELIAAHLRRRNDITGAAIYADAGLVNDTPQVDVLVGGTIRRAVYLAPHAVRAGRPAFVTRMGADKSAPLVVVASNYQVEPSSYTDTAWGGAIGAGGGPAAGPMSDPSWGSGYGTWGA